MSHVARCQRACAVQLQWLSPARMHARNPFCLSTQTRVLAPADGAGYFFIALLILITSSLTMTAHFRLLACVVLSPAAAQVASAFVLIVLITSSGFIIVHYAIPPWTVWMYWLSPFSWSLRAMAINEMTSPRWQDVTVAETGATAGAGGAGNANQSLGDAALQEFDLYTARRVLFCSWRHLACCFAGRCMQCAALFVYVIDSQNSLYRIGMRAGSGSGQASRTTLARLPS